MQFLRWHGQKSIEVIVRYFGFLGSLDSGLLEAIIATYGQCQPDSCFAIQICHNKTEQIWHRQSFWHGESSGFTSFKGKTVFESFLDYYVRMSRVSYSFVSRWPKILLVFDDFTFFQKATSKIEIFQSLPCLAWRPPASSMNGLRYIQDNKLKAMKALFRNENGNAHLF